MSIPAKTHGSYRNPLQSNRHGWQVGPFVKGRVELLLWIDHKEFAFDADSNDAIGLSEIAATLSAMAKAIESVAQSRRTAAAAGDSSG